MKIRDFSFFSILLILYIIGPTRLTIFGISSSRIALVLILIYNMMKRKVSFRVKSYILIYLMSIVLANLFHFTLNNLIWSGLEIFAILVVAPSFVKSRQDIDQFIESFLMVAGVLAILGIIETFTGFNIFDTISGNYVVKYGANSLRFGLTRSRGFLTTSINNAIFLGMAATLCAYRIPVLKKKIYVVVYILLLTNLVSTMSRGVMLIFVLVQLLVWWKYKVITNIVKVLKIISLVVVVCAFLIWLKVPVITMMSNIFNMVAVIFDPSYGESIANDFGMNLNGVGSRIQLYELVWNSVKNHLILGNGYQSHFSVRLTSTITKTSIENTFLAYLYYGGLVGVMGLLSLIFGTIGMAYKKCRVCMKKVSFPWIILVITVAYIASMFTVYIVDDIRLFYVMICLLIAYRNDFIEGGTKCQTPETWNKKKLLGSGSAPSYTHTVSGSAPCKGLK